MLKIADAKTSSRKLSNVNIANTHAQLERKTSNPRDFNCFLIKNPDEMTADENVVKDIFNAFPRDKEMIIEIPS